MGAHLVCGRALSPSLDTPDLKVSNVIVNRAFQRKFFPSGGDAVNAHTDDNGALMTAVVGEYTNLRQSLHEQPMAEMDYLIDELPLKLRLDYLQGMVLVIHTPADPHSLITPVRAAIHSVDATVPFKHVQTMREVMQEEMLFDRMQGWLFGIFAALAVLLSLVGIYGTMQHEVEMRTRDIGIRMALGSSRGHVLGHVLRRVMLLVIGGLFAGWMSTIALQRAISAVVELQPESNMMLFVTISLALLVAGLLASLWPARRAAAVDPMQALRTA